VTKLILYGKNDVNEIGRGDMKSENLLTQSET